MEPKFGARAPYWRKMGSEPIPHYFAQGFARDKVIDNIHVAMILTIRLNNLNIWLTNEKAGFE